MDKLIITRREDKILTALWDGKRVVEFRAEDASGGLKVGDIYLGRVKNLAKNIDAAFVEIFPGVQCFYQQPKGEKRVRAGEEIPVQLIREAAKTKDPVVTGQLSLPGRFLVLVTDRKKVAVSTKITDTARREALKELLRGVSEEAEVGFIVRTNASCAGDAEILAEAQTLIEREHEIRLRARCRTCYSRLYEGEPAYLAAVTDAAVGSIEEVVTDDEEIFAGLQAYAALHAECPPIRFYQDPMISLTALYRIEHFLELALNRRVWLKSGGYLVIEPTEALTVIDVNTGGTESRKQAEETFLRTNLEAAEEIAFQLRLRNLSGIILVDFIDLKDEEHNRTLFTAFRRELKKDRVKTVLVDLTALNLAEVTRKKTRKPLHEQISLKKISRKPLDIHSEKC